MRSPRLSDLGFGATRSTRPIGVRARSAAASGAGGSRRTSRPARLRGVRSVVTEDVVRTHLAIATLLAGALAPTAAQARTPPPKLTGLRCVPATRVACHPRPQVMIGKQVQLRGTGLKAGM